MADIFTTIADRRSAGLPAWLVTVVAVRGSTPRKAGAKMMVTQDGTIVGSIGGGSVEKAVVDDVLADFDGAPRLLDFNLSADLPMCCGGTMTFFLEPLMPKPMVLLFGLGHVGSAIARLANTLEYRLTAVDDDPRKIDNAALTADAQRLESYEPEDLETLELGPNSACVICTHSHQLDQRLLEFLLQRDIAWIGVIGSERKAELQRQRLLAKGFGDTAIAQVHCPMGLDIGADTPAEIAVSVGAELVRFFSTTTINRPTSSA